MSLNPPLIKGTIPAFYGNSIIIPFTINSSVSKNDIGGFAIKIKTLQTNQEKIYKIYDISVWDQNNSILKIDNLENNKFQIGSCYKDQIAYADTSLKTGSFSTVAIAKYTAEPIVEVSLVNGNPRTILGSYITEDPSEKLYSSYFTIHDSQNNLFFKSEEKIHNCFNDSEAGHAEEILNLIKMPQQGSRYSVQFHCKTINEIEKSSEPYSFVMTGDYHINSNIELNAELDYDNGRIALEISSTSLSTLSGKYKLIRTDIETGYDNWIEILDFDLFNEQLPCMIWYDNTIEQGISYQYAIHRYTDQGFYSDKILSQLIFADFEDMFLSDGERQLKIRFNPKVSSFKTTLQESKQDTLGGRYPFIFRNGYINYKEFPISGLISHLEDEKELFYDKKKNFILNSEAVGVQFSETNLTSSNIYNERKFKMDVLNWLTDGKPKVFRSPAEGNYIIRLMNTSLSPLSDGTSRMIHTFSSTAYEIDDYTVESLIKYDFIKPILEIKDNKVLRQVTYPLSKFNEGINLINLLPKGSIVNKLEFFIYQSPSVNIMLNNQLISVYHKKEISNINIETLEGVEKETDYSSSDYVNIHYYFIQEPQVEETQLSKIIETEIPCFQVFGRGAGTNVLHNFIQSKDKRISNMFYCHVRPSPTITIYTKETEAEPSLKEQYYTDIDWKTSAIIIPGLIYKIYDDKKEFVRYQIWDPIKINDLIYNSKQYPSLSCSYRDNNGASGIYQNFDSGSNGVFIEGNLISLIVEPGLIIEIGLRYSHFIYDQTSSNYRSYKIAQDNFINGKGLSPSEDIDNYVLDYIYPAISSKIEVNKPNLQKLGDRMILSSEMLSQSR